jgi:hypothetical protein
LDFVRPGLFYDGPHDSRRRSSFLGLKWSLQVDPSPSLSKGNFSGLQMPAPSHLTNTAARSVSHYAVFGPRSTLGRSSRGG